MQKTTEKGNLIKQYLLRFPTTPSNSIAKIIMKDYPLMFNDKEQVRGIIRTYRGKNGKKNLNDMTDKSFINQEYVNKYNLPAADEISYEPFGIPEQFDRILVLSDIHIPYHSVESIELALGWGAEHNMNAILLNGDIIDFYQLSKFLKNPLNHSAKYEIDKLKEFLVALRTYFPDVKIFYKLGNHEERLENYLKVKAPELFEIEEFRLEKLLKLDEMGIDMISDKRIVYAGKLPILHGHEFNGIAASVNPARGLFLKTKKSAMCGHLHQVSEHSEPDIEDELSTCWSVGCLCQLHPEYARINRWAHGFSFIKTFDGGEFKVFNARIYDNQIL